MIDDPKLSANVLAVVVRFSELLYPKKYTKTMHTDNALFALRHSTRRDRMGEIHRVWDGGKLPSISNYSRGRVEAS